MGMKKEQLKIALLWLVREFQPLSLEQIQNMILTNDNRLLPIFREAGVQRAMYGGINYIDELIKAGLVKTENDERVSSSSKLSTTPALGTIQDLFSISLKEQMKRTEESIVVTPLFGSPYPKTHASSWARIFVAMPFLNSLRPVYNDHILKVATSLGLSCKRGDDFFTANSIIGDVWSAIYHAELCIVDCTGRNPNVFYELGMTHTLGRKAIPIAQNIDDIPFDIRHLRTIIYEDTSRGLEDFETKLAQTIRVELGIQSS